VPSGLLSPVAVPHRRWEHARPTAPLRTAARSRRPEEGRRQRAGPPRGTRLAPVRPRRPGRRSVDGVGGGPPMPPRRPRAGHTGRPQAVSSTKSRATGCPPSPAGRPARSTQGQGRRHLSGPIGHGANRHSIGSLGVTGHGRFFPDANPANSACLSGEFVVHGPDARPPEMFTPARRGGRERPRLAGSGGGLPRPGRIVRKRRTTAAGSAIQAGEPMSRPRGSSRKTGTRHDRGWSLPARRVVT